MTNDPEKKASESTTDLPNGRSSAGEGEPLDEYPPRAQEHPAGTGEQTQPLFGRAAVLALIVWGVMVLVVTGAIAGSTALWPLLPIVGSAVPLGLVFLAVWHAKNQGEALRGHEIRAVLGSDDQAEREVLVALLQSEGLAPAAVAARTSLSVSQASEVLERLAAKGHLDVTAREGNLEYALRTDGRPSLEGGPGSPTRSGGGRAGERGGITSGSAADATADAAERRDEERPPPPAEALDDPLSERELEVMKLLASGRTNREISHELYVSHGTVKAHAANIYRKLGAHSRAEMISRARTLGLLG
jgi:DNA-binding CsgD family transcriptional regulator